MSGAPNFCIWPSTRLSRRFFGRQMSGRRPSSVTCLKLAALVLILGLLAPVRSPQTWAWAAAAPSVRRAVLVLVSALSLKDIDLTLTPNMWKLASTGAVGLMNVRTAKTLQDEHTYVTLGAGTRAQGPPEAGHAFNSDEIVEGAPAATTFARNTGAAAPPPGSVVHPYIARIARTNSDSSYRIVPGALGEALRRAGKKTAVFGNSDTPGHLGRHAAAVAMDSRGVVDLGDVGRDTAIRRDDFPGGTATNTELVAALVRDAVTAGKADLVVVESGDTARVERYLAAGLLTEAAYEEARRLALSSADALVGRLLEFIDFTDTMLLVFAPTPGAREVASGHGLAPVIAAGPGLSSGRPGLLTSPTTRRHGLVASTDVAASILSWLGVDAPPWVLGAPVRVVPHRAPLTRLLSMHDEIASTYLMRAPLLKTFVGLQIVVALASLTLIALAAARHSSLRHLGVSREALRRTSDGHPEDVAMRAHVAQVVRALLLGLGAVPLAMLVLPLARPAGTVSAGIYVATAVLVMCFAARATCGRSPASTPFAAVYLVTGLAVICDALLGSKLMQGSILGYDPIGGARFYGIGNEYMGVLVGSLITGSGLVLDSMGLRRARSAVRAAALAGIGAIFAVALLVLASPSLGANMGGTVTAVVGFGIAYVPYLDRRVTRRELAILAVLAVSLVAGIAVADALRAGGPVSHWGRTVLAVRVDGPAALIDVVRRKTAMNLKLIRYTVWTRALFAFLAAVALLWVRPVGLAKRLMKAHPGFASSLAASLVAAAAAVLANDSGVVAAALLMLYPSLVLLYLAGHEAAGDT
ncbi:MAG: hypothetical protein PWR07_182 [Bacillota bacterium]|nr:hypothetical protein [Bacillota bacterium]